MTLNHAPQEKQQKESKWSVVTKSLKKAIVLQMKDMR